MNAEQIIKTAIEPMRSAASELATQQSIEQIERLTSALEANDWNITEIVNKRFRNASFGKRKEVAAPFKMITAIDDARMEDVPYTIRSRVQYMNVRPDFRVRDDHMEMAFIRQAQKDAESSFDAYAAKMVSKVGDDVVDAKLECKGNAWVRSTLVVTRKDGSIERWNTTMIVNFSVHGKAFNQFPTRKAK
jgi:hypothetical protein